MGQENTWPSSCRRARCTHCWCRSRSKFDDDFCRQRNQWPVLHHDLQEGGMNGQRFNLFLEHLAGQLPPDEMPHVFIFWRRTSAQAGTRSTPARKLHSEVVVGLLAISKSYGAMFRTMEGGCEKRLCEFTRSVECSTTCATHGYIGSNSCTECWHHHAQKCPSLFSPLGTLFT